MRNRYAGHLISFVIALSMLVATSGASLFVQVGTTRTAPAAETRMLERITADSLRGHLSFIASDALEGRGVGTRGIEMAAEYIAAQFRRAGLEPLGDEGYFQTATFTSRRAPDVTLKSRNVIGLLRGSDPALRDTYVIVSAHYDHLGMSEDTTGDRIFNGANDDGSGTVGVLEIAAALSTLSPRPRRSILFIAFTGEELGLRGSRYYGDHPLVPIEKTIAQVNLEQIGRTDEKAGPQVGTAAITGFDYSDVSTILKKAGEGVGVRVYKHETFSDAFFGRSDNQSLADQGVPSHTLCVAFEFPDYHAVGDHWDNKIDYANMEKVVRGVALGVLTLANSDREPKWNEGNPKTEKYVMAWRKRRAPATP